MKKIISIKGITALVFMVFIVLGFLMNNSVNVIFQFKDYLLTDIDKLGEYGAVSPDTIETKYDEKLEYKNALVDYSGKMAKLAGIRSSYSDMGLYVEEDGYIVKQYPWTSTNYEYEELVSFKHFLDENNIKLLYVSEPVKYLTDDEFNNEYGVSTYTNRNTDTFVDRLKGDNIPVIDLRDNIISDNLNIKDMFYYTDHHWNTKAGMWAASKIADGLNEYCGYNIDTTLYDESNYNIVKYEKSWLGEQGKKYGQSRTVLDDYYYIRPAFDTSYNFYADSSYAPIDSEEKCVSGSFDDFINSSIYDTDINVYDSDSWHYSYMQRDCINNNVDYGKVLYLGDSYGAVVEPFLSLSVHELDARCLRNMAEDFEIRDFILNNGYDTVVVCYAQFMVGAHDDEGSVNYRMFDFE